jgi:hypothetical protein
MPPYAPMGGLAHGAQLDLLLARVNGLIDAVVAQEGRV